MEKIIVFNLVVSTLLVGSLSVVRDEISAESGRNNL